MVTEAEYRSVLAAVAGLLLVVWTGFVVVVTALFVAPSPTPAPIVLDSHRTCMYIDEGKC